MDYKEKYEQALERASKLRVQNPFDTVGQMVEHIFPDLRESEDERIRKGLIKAVSGILKGNTLYGTDVTREEALTWLEKQGESDETKAKMFLINKGYPIDTNGIFPTYEEIYNIIRDGLENQNPAWCEKDKNILNRLIGVLDGTNEEDYHESWEETFLPWLKSLKERMQPQSKQYEYLEDFDNEEDYGIDGLYHAINILEKTIGRVEGYQSDDGILSHKVAINAVKELYKKQGEKKSVDKAESKFKVGDWCIDKQDGTIFRIEKVMENIYKYKIDKGNLYYCSHGSLELDSRLWTIEDVKDGDVLVNGSNIFIFHFINDTRLMGYCHVNIDDGRFYDDLGKNECFCLIDAVVNPATKEQRDLFFQKMKEAGYEWDSDKKELKKIEPKTLDVDKVIEWLRIELDKEEKRHYIHVHGFDKERREIFFEDFRKAMKGE